VIDAGQPDPRIWDIWDVEWLHEDGTSKRRPALLIASYGFAEEGDRLPFLQISSIEHRTPHRFDLSISNPIFAHTGLTKDCYVYLSHLQWIEADRLYRRRGMIGASAGSLLTLRIRLAIGFDPR
jgi:hypothetical protein